MALRVPAGGQTETPAQGEMVKGHISWVSGEKGGLPIKPGGAEGHSGPQLVQVGVSLCSMAASSRC